MVMVIWCSASGSEVQKSQLFFALRRLVRGSRLTARLKAQRVAQKKDRRVVAHQVPVALLGIELDGRAANVALGVGGAALAGHRREAQEQVSLLADVGEELGLGVLGDVMGHLEGAVGARALGVHAPLGDHLAIEVGQFL